ncbi:hypothetical protein OJAV_G00221330 [Oryzias javanicus]|uniref:Uncharacterized protein n=1 Tax=Oryzias javanicus TaxID=123683 RepID=A0A3S2P3S5_ORYJA|nr:hypothetical protein OJAV_G00221330 [Oryzias javanicus]
MKGGRWVKLERLCSCVGDIATGVGIFNTGNLPPSIPSSSLKVVRFVVSAKPLPNLNSSFKDKNITAGC